MEAETGLHVVDEPWPQVAEEFTTSDWCSTADVTYYADLVHEHRLAVARFTVGLDPASIEERIRRAGNEAITLWRAALAVVERRGSRSSLYR